MNTRMDRETLRQQLLFYRDLGFHELYRRSPATPVAEAIPESAPEPIPDPVSTAMESLFPAPEPTPAKAVDASLVQIMDDIGDCRRCRLCEARNKIVFGVGDSQAPLVFVGEGPGADEDAQGIPFVGRAGQLLTQMIEGTAKKEGFALVRDQVYIANVVKCRPPDNRTPLPDEMDICGPFLERQLLLIKPKAIVALGSTAAKYLLRTKEGVTKMRGNWYTWNGIKVMVTYHPSYLLRQYNQNAKREAWEDLKKVLHFVYGGE